MNEFKVLTLPAPELETQLATLDGEGWKVQSFSSPVGGQYAVLLKRETKKDNHN